MCENFRKIYSLFYLGAYIYNRLFKFFFKNFILGIMKIIFLTVVNFSLANIEPAKLPEKLLLYQNVTGIGDETILKIFDDSNQGKLYV